MEKLINSNIEYFDLQDIKMHNFYYNKSKNIVFYEKLPKLDCSKRDRHSVSLNYLIFQNLDKYSKLNKGVTYSINKTKTACYVNAIHCLDASYLRRIAFYCKLYGISILVIHDGFGVAFNKVNLLIDIANIAFCENLNFNNELVAKNKIA